MMIPGVVVGFLAAGGNGHSMSLWIMTVANGLVYAALAYRLLTVWGKRIAQHQSEASEASGSGGVRKS